MSLGTQESMDGVPIDTDRSCRLKMKRKLNFLVYKV